MHRRQRLLAPLPPGAFVGRLINAAAPAPHSDPTMIVVRCPDSYLPERKYILDVMLRDFLDVDYRLEFHTHPDVCIFAANPASNRVITLPDVLFQTPQSDWLTTTSLPRSPLPRHNLPAESASDIPFDRSVPLVYGRLEPNTPFITSTGRTMTIALDIFGSAFFMLTRYEEYVVNRRDSHGRFPPGASLSARESIFDRPLVNEYLELLWRALTWLDPSLQRSPRRSRIILSHDVDRPLLIEPGDSWRSVLRKAFRDLHARRPVAQAFRRLSSYICVRALGVHCDPYNTFDFIMDEAERHGLRTTFNLMTGATNTDFDPPCYVDDPFMSALAARVLARRHLLGFHPSYGTAATSSRFAAEFTHFQRLLHDHAGSSPVFGGRQHYLRFQNPGTWRNWDHSGAAYDSTLGFADRAGFRCGVCYDYPVFDLDARTTLRLREQPLIAMDTAILKAAGHSLAHARSSILRMHAICRRYNGDFTLLVHNSTLHTRARRRWFSDVLRLLTAAPFAPLTDQPGASLPISDALRQAA